MSSTTQVSLDNADLEKLNDSDKADLRQFLNNQGQRSQIQARTCLLPSCSAIAKKTLTTL